ncbi:MAG: peptidase C15 [Cyanobacteria bacterium P01_F01_bin.143]
MLLFTSFQTWLPHQESNSSDELLAIVQKRKKLAASGYFLRQLPVEREVASQQAITTIKKVQPQGIICCGMAESRPELTIEFCANYGQECLSTTVNLEDLVNNLAATSISHDAGKFVCEALYFNVLNYLQNAKLQLPCIFVHVPILTSKNTDILVQDFAAIISYLENLV